MFLKIVLPMLILAAIAVIFGLLLSYVGKKLAVKRDEKIERTEKLLAGANCGGCGFAGCAAFAEALAKGKAELSACGATSKENKAEISAILGIASGGEEKVIVPVCGGGTECADAFDYRGFASCAYAASLDGGAKACNEGCLGLKDCAAACTSGAISFEKGLPVVDKTKCVECGACALACPKHIMQKIPASATVYVKCLSCEKGKKVRDVCKNGCIACGLCAKNCPEQAIEIKNNLAVIDYSKCIGCGLCAQKCPAHCIETRISNIVE